jgi:hypothetical protein
MFWPYDHLQVENILLARKPEHVKTPPAAERHHTTVKKQQIHTNRKETGVDVTPQKIATRPTHKKIET